MKNLFNNYLKITIIITIQFVFSSCFLLEKLGIQNLENKTDSNMDLTYNGKPADMTKPVKVFILMGQSNMVGAGVVEPDGKEGTLANATKTKGLYQHLLNPDKSWIVRKDVRNVFAMASGSDPWSIIKNDWLTAADTKNIGPELGFGYIMGQYFDEPVLILKSCIGNRSLGFDLLPPGSVQHQYDGYTYGGFGDAGKWLTGTTMPAPGSWPAGIQYVGDTSTAKDVLADLGTYYPGATKYEIAGFVFWQGDKDRYDAGHASRYETNLVNFIKALRNDFNAPNAPFVCATLGQTRKGATGNDALIFDAQLAVDGDNGKYPEFARNVATVYSNPLSMGGSSNGHYNGNAETYENVGEALGWAMVKLLDHNKLVSIKINPPNSSVEQGGDLQFIATAYYADGLTEDVTSTVIWTSTNTSVATISNSAGTEGFATGIAVGGTKIKATLGEISDTTVLTIVPIEGYQVILNETTEKSEWVKTAVLDNQGRLLIGGRLENASWEAAIWRYNRDGTPDTSFGTNGVVSWNSPDNNNDYVYCIKVKPDGTILLGGVSIDSLGDSNAFLGRLLPNGQPDTGFSPDGFKYIDIDVNRIRRRESLTFDSSDRLLFSGMDSLGEPWIVGITRITTSGIIDTTFGNMAGYFVPSKPPAREYQGGIIVDSGYIYKAVVTDAGGGTSKIYKLNELDGSQVDLLENIPVKVCHGIAIHGDYLYIGGYLLSPERYAWVKINKTDFTYDLSYGNNSIGDGSPQTDGGRGCHISVNANGEVYIGGTSSFHQDGMIIKATTLGSVDTSWGTFGAISYVSVGGVGGQWDNVSSTVFYDDKIFIFGNTVTEINSTLYKKMFIHYRKQ